MIEFALFFWCSLNCNKKKLVCCSFFFSTVLRNAFIRRPSHWRPASMRPTPFRWTTRRFLCWLIQRHRNREWCFGQLECTNHHEWYLATNRLGWWHQAFDGRSWRHSNPPKRWPQLVQSSCTSLILGRTDEQTNRRSASPRGLVMAAQNERKNKQKKNHKN